MGLDRRTKLSVFNWLEHSHSSNCSLSVSEEIKKHPNSLTRRSIKSFIQRKFSHGIRSYIGKHIVVHPLCLSSRLNDTWDTVLEENKLKVCRLMRCNFRNDESVCGFDKYNTDTIVSSLPALPVGDREGWSGRNAAILELCTQDFTRCAPTRTSKDSQ
ncbi:hypothetical protein J6590_035902 [Homalodisca vitripennis]|nr:hypothetical protein J6590_035902 [Homalodisca vitripennis]